VRGFWNPTGELGNIIHRVVAPRVQLVPRLKQLATDSQTPALRRSDLVLRPRLRRTLAGRLCPNAILDDDRRFDDVAAGRFAIVTSTQPSATQRAEIERRGAVLIVARPGSELFRWLRAGNAHAAIVRPDGTVLSAGRQLSKLCNVLPGFNMKLPHKAAPGTARE
jgi:3-(3-hydroxy-phenyl)propionate hydroxylase